MKPPLRFVSTLLLAPLAALGPFAQVAAAESAPTLVSHDLTALTPTKRFKIQPNS